MKILLNHLILISSITSDTFLLNVRYFQFCIERMNNESKPFENEVLKELAQLHITYLF